MPLVKVVVTSAPISDGRLSAVFLTALIFVMLYPLYAYSVDVVEVAPSGAAEDHRSCWDMQIQVHHFCCICVCLLCESRGCEPCFLQCSSLERASRSLAKTGFYFSCWNAWKPAVFHCLFSVLSFWRPWRILWGPLGRFGSNLGSLLGSFSLLFQDKVDL